MVGYHPKATQILGALKSRDLENISWHCNIFSNHNGNQITMQVIRQYATNQGIDINDGIDGRYDTQDTLQICAALARIFDHPPWDVRERFVRAPADMVQEMERHFTKNSDKYWKKLTGSVICGNWYKYCEPIHLVKKYYGERFAFYFLYFSTNITSSWTNSSHLVYFSTNLASSWKFLAT